ncbi:MAG: ribose-phosphate pyrophosphokinase [Candidatus Diapherotrites archaeon]|nr:ribose-phosphate pyrophosphokinase [Candidatus Diapherotrites archaeon]
MLFSGTANPDLAQGIAKYLARELGKVEIKRFSDGETYVRFFDNIRGKDVFLIQSTCAPASETLMELLIMIDAAKRASAARVTAVIPYFGYARQDRKAASREPITAKLVANIISKAGADRVITLDLHSGQLQGFFDIPLDNLTASIKLMEDVKHKNLDDCVVVAPDAGAAKNTTRIAKRLGCELAIVNKAREKHNEAQTFGIIGSVEGKNCVMFDDMIDTAGTICSVASALKDAGAKEVCVYSAHGLFSGDAIEKISRAPIAEVVVTDSIPQKKLLDKMRVLSVADLIGEAITRCHENRSVSSLFE